MGPVAVLLPVVTKDLPISPRCTPYELLSRYKFSTLTTRQPMVEFTYSPRTIIALSATDARIKILLDKNRTHDFRTSRCAGYLLDHSGDESIHWKPYLLLQYPHFEALFPRDKEIKKKKKEKRSTGFRFQLTYIPPRRHCIAAKFYLAIQLCSSQ